MKAASKVVAPLAHLPLDGLKETGRIFVIGQSSASKLVHFMKMSMNIKGVEYQVSKGPLTDYKVNTLIAYLEMSKLR